MNPSPKLTYLNYSKIPSVPILGSISYAIQNYLYSKGVINNIFASRKETHLQKTLFKKISKSSILVCRSFKFGRLLKDLDSEIVLDILIKDFEKLSSAQLYDLMWSLVFASCVTKNTKKRLKDIIPENFPENETVVIPYNDSFDVVCDYIFQTAKVLANKGDVVSLIALANPISILKHLFKKGQEKSKRQEFFDKNNIVVINPLTLFPLRLTKLKFIEKINKRLALIYTSLFIRKTNANYLWCFDPVDIELVRLTNKFAATIYDCVDYFSTLDLELDKKIKKDETLLINSVDFFFVNSQALEKTKGKIRKPNAVVPQGFDIEAFTTKKPPTGQEIKEIENLKNIFRKIPRPRVGFVGSLTYRLDFKLLSTLIKKMPDVSFVFTDAFLPMPHDDRFIGTEKLLKQIRQAPNVYLVPKTLSRRVVKEILGQFNIGIIPYDASFDFNRYCYPMKLFEYFYMGIPVLSTPIEELKRFSKFVKISNSAKGWEGHIKTLISESWPESYKIEQKTLAERESWENKINEIVQILGKDNRLYA